MRQLIMSRLMLVNSCANSPVSATRSASPGDVIAAPTSVSMFTGSDVRIRFDKEPLAHVSIAFEGPEASSPDTIPMQVLAKCLGSWSEASGIAVPGAQKVIFRVPIHIADLR